MNNALQDGDRGLGNLKVEIQNDAFDFIARLSHGDARVALNTLEAAVMLAKPDQEGDRGLGNLKVEIQNDAFDFIARLSHGDARVALNTLEAAVMLAKPDQE